MVFGQSGEVFGRLSAYGLSAMMGRRHAVGHEDVDVCLFAA